MLANIKPGKPARIRGAPTTPHVDALIRARRRGSALEPVMSRVMSAMGFDSFMYGMSNAARPLRQDARAFVWTTLPPEWVQRYAQMGYIEVDPRATETFNRTAPLVWDAHDYRHEPRCAAFFADAARFGVCSGVVVPFSDCDHQRIVCAFNSTITPVPAARRRALQGRLGEIMLFAGLFHQFFMANLVDTEQVLVTRDPPLSRREQQCLELSARGMTSNDIGAKLGIKGRTANFHVSNIIRKTGVLNRKEAIAVAVARGWIRVDPALLQAAQRPPAASRRA